LPAVPCLQGPTQAQQTSHEGVRHMNYSDDSGWLGGVFWVFWLIWLVLILVAGWKMYVKAGQQGWVSLIPIINILGLLKIVHRPWWWILLMLIPFVNVVVAIIIMLDLAKAFGHGVGMALLLILLTPIGYLMLGFGGSQYQLQKDPLFG
jgi:hypothetical protein